MILHICIQTFSELVMLRKSLLAVLCRTSEVTKRVSRELSTWKFNFHCEIRATSRDLFFPLALYIFSVSLFHVFVASYSPPFFADLISPGRRRTPRQAISTSFSSRVWWVTRGARRANLERDPLQPPFALGDRVNSYRKRSSQRIVMRESMWNESAQRNNFYYLTLMLSALNMKKETCQ